MSTEENKAIVTRYLKEAWDKGNVAVLDEILAPNFRSHSGERIGGREEEKQLISMFLAAFGNFRSTIGDLVADGDKVCIRWSAVGTQQAPFMGIPASGKQIPMSGMEIHRVENGKITDIWVEFDMMGLMQQLGAIPSPGSAGG